MATGQLSHEEVKSICNSLECSPSQHDSHGNYGGAPNIDPTAKSGKAAAGNHHLATPESEFNMTDRGRPLPNYAKQFAHNAHKDKV